jgi:hypothetical protein
MSETVTQTATPPAPQVNTPDLDVRELAGVDSAVMLQTLSRNCVAMKVHITKVTAEKKIDGAVIKVNDHDVPQELVSGARFKMVPKEITSPLNRIESAARLVPASRGTAFVGGAYLVPIGVRGRDGKSAAETAFSLLSNLQSEYSAKAAELKPSWEAHVTRIQTDFPTEYELLKKWFISGDEFVARHRISTMLFPLGAGLPVNFNERLESGMSEILANPLLNAADVAVIERVKPLLITMIDRAAVDVGTLVSQDQAASWVTQAQATTSEAIADAVKKMIQEPLTEFAESLANMEGILARGGTVKTSTIQAVKSAYEKLMGFSFMAPNDLKTRLGAVGNILNGLNYRELNSSEASARELAQHFAGIREEMTAPETHTAVYGSFVRKLAL